MEELAAAVVRLYEHTDRVSAVFLFQDARRRTRSSFEPMRDHAGSSADISFGDRTALRRVDRLEGMLLLHVKSIDVVQKAVIRFGDDRQAEIA